MLVRILMNSDVIVYVTIAGSLPITLKRTLVRHRHMTSNYQSIVVTLWGVRQEA